MPTENQNFDESVKGRKATPHEVAYRDGYVQGRANEYHEQRYQRARDAQLYERNARDRANDSAASGLLLGLIIAAILGGLGTILYFAGRDNTAPAVIDVDPPQPEVSQPQEEPNNTTIIERTIERTQEAAPSGSDIELPDVNIQVPNPTDTAPAPAEPSTAPQPEAENSALPAVETPSATDAAPDAAPQ